MDKSKVAIVRTSPATVLADYGEAMNLAGYQDVIARDADTGLKVNISWHFFYPGSSTRYRHATSGRDLPAPRSARGRAPNGVERRHAASLHPRSGSSCTR